MLILNLKFFCLDNFDKYKLKKLDATNDKSKLKSKHLKIRFCEIGMEFHGINLS